MNTFRQTSLFEQHHRAQSAGFVESLLETGAALSISVSGGKDSDAMLRYLMQRRQQSSWPGEVHAVFCELGRIEWLGVTEHLKKLCAELSIPLITLYPNRPMIEEWQRRYDTILAKQEDKPFWSSASTRYCTDREKTQTSNKFFRGSSTTEKPFWSSSSSRFCTKHEKVQPADKQLRGYNFVVCAIGLRAEESTARASKPRYQVRDAITSKNYKTPASCKTAEQKEQWAEEAYEAWEDSGRKGRFAISWHPIHTWTLDHVWQQNGTSCVDVARRVALYQSGKIEQAIAGFPCHWVYATGNTRLSCSLCVLGNTNDISNGAKHNPQTWAKLALMEIVGGWGFQSSRWLASLSSEVLEMSLQQRQQLYQTLIQLDMLDPWSPQILLTLLRCCSPYWSETALTGIAQVIAHYWEERQTKSKHDLELFQQSSVR